MAIGWLGVSGGVLVDTASDGIAIAVTGSAAWAISRQQLGHYPNIKQLLVASYILFEGVLVLELLREYITMGPFMNVYAVLGISFVLGDVALLTVVGYVIYSKPTSERLKDVLGGLISHFPHNWIVGGLSGLIVFSDLTVAFAPGAYSIGQLRDILGETSGVKTVIFGAPWLVEALIILLVFIGYTTTLFFLTAQRAKDSTTRRALYVIPIAWVLIGIELVVFNGYLVGLGHNLLGPGYIISSVAFAVTAFALRDRATVANFFGPVQDFVPPANPFSRRMNRTDSLVKGIYLLEIDPSSEFEEVIRDFALEETSKQTPVFLFSSRGTIVYNTLSQLPGIRLYTHSDKVSFPKASGRPYELLIPRGDQAVLFDALDKTITSTQFNTAIVYDSISDLILLWGIEDTYKFLKGAAEILASPNVTALFLVIAGAHDERALSLIRNIFPNQLRYTRDSLVLLRRSLNQ